MNVPSPAVDHEPLRPADFSAWLLQAMTISEERRRRRKRDTTPDAVGLAIKRSLLSATLAEDPDPADFGGWLLDRALDQEASGPARALAGEVLAEYQHAVANPDYRAWLAYGAPTGPIFAPTEEPRTCAVPPDAH